jgi:arylsulfotransferase ASST
VGSGENVILDTSYRQLATVRAANGLSADLHEFQLTPRDTALITVYYPVYRDASSVGGQARQIVMDSVVQEIDVKTGLLLFQWDSLDHVSLSDTYTAPPKRATQPLDYFHVNSVEEDRDGNLVISARNTWAAYKVDRQTGKMIWTLGGKRSSFKMGPGASFAFQHDVRVQSPNDRVVTLFDNGGGPPRASEQSRGLTLVLDLKRMTASRGAEYRHAPARPANFEGNLQQLPNGHAFIGWGQQPYFTQFDSRGQVVLSGRFIPATANYRAYTFAWKARPSTPPAVSALKRGAETVVYASWNGATDVASWRVLAGDRAGALKPVVTADKRGFETEVMIGGAHRYVAVQALDRMGHTLGTSAAAEPS